MSELIPTETSEAFMKKLLKEISQGMGVPERMMKWEPPSHFVNVTHIMRDLERRHPQHQLFKRHTP
jgi:hypothetical protein